MTVEQWLGEDNQIGIDIWYKKYRDGEETWDQWADRVSGGDPVVREMIVRKEFLFGGRILANRGLSKNDRKITYSNCYVLPVDDSIESIFECGKQLARTFSYGGGVGIDLGNLAPRGATIRNAAKTTSGAVSFMDLYSLITGLIGQDGRRGALMISMPVDHPDIEEFITVKQDLDRVTKANISVRITDEFMRAVEDGSQFRLHYTRKATGETIEKFVDARELFAKIAQCNWDTGEPGVLFWDRIKNWNYLNKFSNFEFAGVNPCFTGDMELLTKDGYKRFDELTGNEVDLINIDGDTSHGKVWPNGVKPTVKITFADKSYITCTPDHVFMTIDGDECRAKDLNRKRVMPLVSYKHNHNLKFVKLGYVQGDGQLTEVLSPSKRGITVNVGLKDDDIRDLFYDEEVSVEGDRRIYVNGFNDLVKELQFSLAILPEREFPFTYKDWSIENKASFLCGCYSANGSIIKGSRISYKTTSKIFADQLVSTLSSDFGISAYITTNKSKPVEFKNGTYVCRESYDINIGQQKDIRQFARLINFYQNYKRIHLKKLLEAKAPRVYSVVDNGEATVYDFSEPLRHWGVVNGIVAHNCAEEPLPAGGSCLLGSINLSAFVKNPFTPDAEFDYKAFANVAESATRALNDVLDEGLPLHPLEIQRECVRDWRQIGLGMMGLGDALIMLGIKYGSKEAVEFSNKLANVLAVSAINESALLAEDCGRFPKFESESFLTSTFGQRLGDICRDQIVKHGVRNSQLLTIAPTGTLATMLGISSGIEPIYALSYTRKTESLHGHDEYYQINAKIVEDYSKVSGKTDLPDYFVGSSDISIDSRIAMQAAWQEWIDASISSTVNLPEDTSVDDIQALYMKAWKAGLKGLTVFRNNCKRVGILTTPVADPEPEANDRESDMVIPRGYIIDVPEELTYRKYKIQSGCGKLYLFVGVDESERRIYDVFTNTDGTGGCSINTQANSRLLSACVRGGVPVEYVIEQLKKSGTCPNYQYSRGAGKKLSPGKSCPSSIAYILQEILNEFNDDEGAELSSKSEMVDVPEAKSTHIVYAEKCPECGTESLIHDGGCTACTACGYGKCS